MRSDKEQTMRIRHWVLRTGLLLVALGLAAVSTSCDGSAGMGMGYSAPGAGWGAPWTGGYSGGPITY
jgi:hypothetical protein